MYKNACRGCKMQSCNKWNDAKDWREKKGRGESGLFVTFDKYFILTKRILKGTANVSYDM